MMVCHCNLITSGDIEAIVRSILNEDPWQLVVPGHIYRALQKRGDCCGCIPNLVDIITRVTEEYHLAMEGKSADLNRVRQRLQSMRDAKRKGGDREGKREGYRAA